MEFDPPQFVHPITGTSYELLSLQEFKERIKRPELSTPTLNYKMQHDHLDYVRIGHFRFIIWNEKAREMTVLERRPLKKK